MQVSFRISSDSNKNNRAQTIICIPTSSSRSNSHSTFSTYSIKSLCKDSHPKNPLLTSSDSTVLQHKQPRWPRVTILVSITCNNNITRNKLTVEAGWRQVLVVRHNMGQQRGTSAAPTSYQTPLYNSCVSLSFPKNLKSILKKASGFRELIYSNELIYLLLITNFGFIQ